MPNLRCRQGAMQKIIIGNSGPDSVRLTVSARRAELRIAHFSA